MTAVDKEFEQEFGSVQWFLFTEGFITQDNTWWGKRINQYVERIKSGEFGIVKAGWFERSYGGAQIPYFTIEYNKKSPKYITVKVTESGIFYPSKSGGWLNLDVSKP